MPPSSSFLPQPAVSMLGGLAAAGAVTMAWKGMKRHELMHTLPPRLQGSREGSQFAVVTGAASGIGLQTTLTLLRLGWRVAAMDRNEMDHLVQQWDKECAVVNGSNLQKETALSTFIVDLTSPGSIQTVTETISSSSGPRRIDAIVHCAGINHEKPLLACSEQEMQMIFAVKEA